MEKMLRINEHMKRHMPLYVMGAMVLGLLLPRVFAVFLPWMTLLLALQTFANTLGGSARDLGAVLRRPLPIVVLFFLLHLVMPAVALVLGRLLFPHQPDLVSGLVLQFTLPAGVNTLMWAGMWGGDMALGLSMVLLDTLLSPLTIPVSLQLLLGTTVELDMSGMMGSLLVMVVVPAVLAMALYGKDEGRRARKLKQGMQLPSKLAMMLLIAANGSKCSEFFRDFDPWLLTAVAVVLVLTTLGYVVGYLVSGVLRVRYPTRITMSVDVGYRNLSAGMVLAQQYFAQQALLPVALTPLFQNILVSLVLQMLQKTRQARQHAAETAGDN